MYAHRRHILTTLAALAASPAWAQAQQRGRRPANLSDPAIAAIERKYGGRLGVFGLDTGDRRILAWRGDERFTLCSTFKGLLAAQALAKVDAGGESLSRRIPYTAADLMPVSPVTARHVESGGMTVEALAQAMVETSDNTAAVLMMRQLGGPEGLTRWLRSIGDDATRLDRYEPEVNLYDPILDTSTPRAIVATTRRILLGNALSPRSRALLERWMIASATGANRLRAAFPKDWIAGDKTGTSTARQTNDYAIVRPPGRRPLLIAAYYDAPQRTPDERELVLRLVGEAFVTWARLGTALAAVTKP